MAENTDALRVLKDFFGYGSFRPLQEEVISAALSGEDTLAVMPPAGGKSLCYEIPALMLEGTALVLSPYADLVREQAEELQGRGIPAMALCGSSRKAERMEAFGKMAAGELRILFVSQKLLSDEIARLSGQKISLIAVEEAQCASALSPCFRRQYAALGAMRERFSGVPVMALSPAADRSTRADIAAQLRLRDPKVFTGSFALPNITLSVKAPLRKREKLSAILDLARRHQGGSGIIFCRAVKTAQSLTEDLRREGITAAAFYPALPADEKIKVAGGFREGLIQVLCAAGGLGAEIEKPDVRFAVHYTLPKSIEDFLAETGRAGRDGLPAESVLLYTAGDLMPLRQFAESGERSDVSLARLERMREYAESQVCRHRAIRSYFGDFGEAEGRCGSCDICSSPEEQIDGTVIVQKALSALVRTKEQIGTETLTDILRGIPDADVLSHGYDRIKTFGAGRDLSEYDWRNYIAQMLQLGFMEADYSDGCRLRVTPLGREVLKGRKAELAKSRYREFRVTKRGWPETQAAACCAAPPRDDSALLGELLDLRLQIARMLQRPESAILKDSTIQELVREKPTDEEQFAGTEGVGEARAELLGGRFLQAIRPYARGGAGTDAKKDNGAAQEKKDGPDCSLEDIRRIYPNAYRPWTAREDALLWKYAKGGMTVPEIAEKLGRNEGSIRGRLDRFGRMHRDAEQGGEEDPA